VAVSVVAMNAITYSSTGSPDITASWTPLENDLVVAWTATDTNATHGTVTGWTDAAGTNPHSPGDGSMLMSVLYHFVTGAEQTAGTTTWDPAGMWATGEAGEQLVVVLRGVNTTTPIDNFAITSAATPTTSQALPGLDTNNSAGSLVLCGIIADLNSTYITPSGWSLVQASTNTRMGGGVYQRDSLTTAGDSFASTTITSSVSDEYTAVTLAFTAAAPSEFTGSGDRNTTVAITATGSLSAISGPPSTGLILRYKADSISGNNGDAISAWPESSGNSHPDAVQATSGNQPMLAINVVNGHKGVTFDGTNDRLTMSGTALDAFRNRTAANFYIVYKTNVITGTKTLASWSSGSSTTSTRASMTAAANVSTGGRRLDADAGGVFLSGGAALANSNPQVLMGRYVYSGSDLYIVRNGTQLASEVNFQTAGSTSDTASQAGVIGSNSGQTAEFFSGTIMEILIYNSDDTALREQVHSYIANEYSITILGLGNGNSPTTVSLTATGALEATSYQGSGSQETIISLTATGFLTQSGSASRSVTVSGTADGIVSAEGSAAVAVTATGTASGALETFGTATTFTTVSRDAAGATSGVGNRATTVAITANGVLQLTGSADRAASVSITAAGDLILVGSANQAANVTITAAGLITTVGSGAISVTITSTADGFSSTPAARSVGVSLTATGFLSSTGQATGSTTVNRTALGSSAGNSHRDVSINLAAFGSPQSSVSRTVSVTLTAQGVLSVSSASNLATSAVLTADGFASEDSIQTTSVVITATGVLSASGSAMLPLAASLTAEGGVQHSGSALCSVTVTMSAVGAIQSMPAVPDRDTTMHLSARPRTTGISVVRTRQGTITAKLID
jgi:hypothetical protein